MNEAQDKVLEHALRELLYEETTDLPQKVLRALRDSELSEVQSETGVGKILKRYLWPLAAAAVVVALLLINESLQGSAPDDSVLVATSEHALGVLREGDPDTHMQSSFQVGETLVNGPLRESQVTLSSGESITLGRCSMLTFEYDDSGLVIAPLVGQVTVQTSARSDLRVRTSLGTLAVGDAGKLQIEMLADGYGLENPEQFQQLAREIHMKTSVALILTLVTVVEGTALLENATGARQLVAGETIQDHEDKFPAKVIKSKLLEAVGTWELTMTQMDQNGEPGKSFKGEEICQAGPGDKWLITDMTVFTDPQTMVHTVVGYNGGKRAYTGTLFDNFGGEMGLIRGTVGEDLESRTLNMFSAEGTSGFDLRWRMSWVSPSERLTVMEVLRGEDWVQISEIIHRRKE